ncbi:MAG: alpha/beta hydrolase [Brumimicrobium sp.]
MEDLVLIHGALGNKKEFDSIVTLLDQKFIIHLYEIPHHGEKKNSKIPFTLTHLSSDFISYLKNIGPCYIYGFSLGGYLALHTAQIDSTYIKGIITQGTKLKWTPVEAKKEVKSLDLNFLKENVQPFYQYLESLHTNYLPGLLKKTSKFMLDLGDRPTVTKDSVKNISVPVRMVRGGKDKMVTKAETIEICESLKNGIYFEISSFIHPVGFLKPKFVARMIDVQLQSMHYKYASTKYGDMAYQEIGDLSSDDTLLLFLHEAIGSIAQWQDFPTKLCETLKLPGIILEFPGYGFSSSYNIKRDEKYLHNFALNHLPAFLKTIDLNKKIIIIGHSDGGTNALLYSSKYPQNIKGIVTMAAHVLNEKETKEGVQPAIDAYEAGKMKGLEMYHGDKTETVFYAWANTWLSKSFSNWNISEDIKNNSTPALVIQGKNDQYGTDKQVHLICNLIKNATPIFIESCGHAPHIEQKTDVIQNIKQWRKQLN